MSSPLVVLGRGRGLGSVLRTLRDLDNALTVIVATAEPSDGGPTADLGDPAVTELLRSLEALADDRAALARALRRPLTLHRLGSHPLGDLVLGSLASAFGDLGVASIWLGDQLEIGGAVIPATVDPLSYVIETERPVSSREGDARGVPATGVAAGGPEPRRLRLIPARPQTSRTATDAIAVADLIVLAPGALFSSVLAAVAIPAIGQAMRAAPGKVLWIANLHFDVGDSLNDQLDTLQRHQVRVDAVLFDPRIDPPVDAERLAAHRVEAIPRGLGASATGDYSDELLGAALSEVLGGLPRGAGDGSPPG